VPRGSTLTNWPTGAFKPLYDSNVLRRKTTQHQPPISPAFRWQGPLIFKSSTGYEAVLHSRFSRGQTGAEKSLRWFRDVSVNLYNVTLSGFAPNASSISFDDSVSAGARPQSFLALSQTNGGFSTSSPVDSVCERLQGLRRWPTCFAFFLAMVVRRLRN